MDDNSKLAVDGKASRTRKVRDNYNKPTRKTFSLTHQIKWLKVDLECARAEIVRRSGIDGQFWAIQREHDRLQRWLVESNQDKAKWESAARGVVGLVLAVLQNHGHWDKAASCAWCRQAEKVLESLGFKLAVGDVALPGVPWRSS